MGENQFSHLFLEFMEIFSSAWKASTKSKKQTETTLYFIERAIIETKEKMAPAFEQ